MKLARLIDRVNVLSVTFADAGSYAARLVECRRGGECVEAERARHPVIVVVGGYGVLTKNAASAGDVLERVTAQGSGFVFTREGDSVSFVRQEQLNLLAAEFAGKKVVEIRCTGEQPEEAARRWFAERVNLRAMLEPSAAGSAIAGAVAARLKLPVLAAALIALVVNMMLAPDVQVRHQEAAIELQALRKTIGQQDDATRRRQELLAEYGATLPQRVSLLCDRLAMVLPDGMTLTSLAVQPPQHSPENGRKLSLAVGRIEIGGVASDPEDVARYVAAVSEQGIASQVRLASMEQEGESGSFAFEISLEL